MQKINMDSHPAQGDTGNEDLGAGGKGGQSKTATAKMNQNYTDVSSKGTPLGKKGDTGNTSPPSSDNVSGYPVGMGK